MIQDLVARILTGAAGKRVLCIGDIMLDRFIFGDVRRISPEAPIPIFAQREEKSMLGAAGNVARNVAALGGIPILIGIIGDDRAGEELIGLLSREGQLESDLVVARGRPTTVKVRYVSAAQQILRVDREDCALIDSGLEDQIIDAVKHAASGASVFLLSDYSKGVLTNRVVDATISIAKAHKIPVIVDPKGINFSRYGAADIIKPNAHELAAAVNMQTSADAEIEAALASGLERWMAGSIIVTRGGRGAVLAQRGQGIEYIKAQPQEVFDVSGAGDTMLAALGVGLAGGGTPSEAAKLAVLASGVAVSKIGTATVSAAEALEAAHAAEVGVAPYEKIAELPNALEEVLRWKARGRRVGFTNGCFDILHPGHVSLLRFAKSRCDRLIVGLNSDNSVRRLKGPKRPINDLAARAAVLAALEAVDLVISFDDDTPTAVIEALKPDLLVKGADYEGKEIAGANFVESYGGEVALAPLIAGHSTTEAVNKAKSSF